MNDAQLTTFRAVTGFWYLASPYSKYAPGLEAAHDDICSVAAGLIDKGVNVLSPIAHSHPVAKIGLLDPLGWKLWSTVNLPLMAAAHGMIVVKMNGWADSVGVLSEIEAFSGAGKPIEYIKPVEWL